MPKSLRCGDVFPGCDFVARAATDDEVIALTTQHAREKHELKEMDWALLAKLCGAIRNGDEASSSAA